MRRTNLLLIAMVVALVGGCEGLGGGGGDRGGAMKSDIVQEPPVVSWHNDPCPPTVDELSTFGQKLTKIIELCGTLPEAADAKAEATAVMALPDPPGAGIDVSAAYTAAKASDWVLCKDELDGIQ